MSGFKAIVIRSLHLFAFLFWAPVFAGNESDNAGGVHTEKPLYEPSDAW